LYGPLVYLWCRRWHLQPADAADLAQDVFTAMLAKVAEFRRDRPDDSFRGWLWTIAQNKIRDRFRRRHEQAQGGTDAQQRLAQIPDSSEESNEAASSSNDAGVLERRVLEGVRAGVEDRTWEAFWRITVGGQAVADIAADLGITAAAVYKAKYRVARLIRQEIRELGE
jgi:RNA polymerase sigma-70 factor (ECF subfamily)